MSISIALRAAQRSTIKEGQLSYGFKKTPIDRLPGPKVWRNIPEEKLLTLTARAIELKKPKGWEEDEFKVDDSDEDTSISTQSKPIDTSCVPSYSEIGYSESLSNYRKFVNVPISTTPNPCAIPLVESEYTGRIINVPPRNYEYEQIMELISEHCYPKEVMT